MTRMFSDLPRPFRRELELLSFPVRLFLNKKKWGSLTQSHSDEQGQRLHGAAISSTLSRLPPFTFIFLQKPARGTGNSRSVRCEGLAARCRHAAHRAKRDHDTLPPVLPLGALHTLLDHPAAPTFESFSNLGSALRLRPLNATAFRSFYSRVFRPPRPVPGPSKHRGAIGKPSEVTNKYFNHH